MKRGDARRLRYILGAGVMALFFFYIWHALRVLGLYHNDDGDGGGGGLMSSGMNLHNLQGTEQAANTAFKGLEDERVRLEQLMARLDEHTRELEERLDSEIAADAQAHAHAQAQGLAKGQGKAGDTPASSAVQPSFTTPAAGAEEPPGTLATDTDAGSGSGSRSGSGSGVKLGSGSGPGLILEPGEAVPGARVDGSAPTPNMLVVGGTDGSGTRKVVQTLASLGVAMVRCVRESDCVIVPWPLCPRHQSSPCSLLLRRSGQ